MTYGELEARARRCAARLRRLGLEPGDRVAIVTADKLPFLAAHRDGLEEIYQRGHRGHGGKQAHWL